MPDDKLLSIVIFGRNDNYGGDFKYRVSTAINFLCQKVERIGRLEDMEVVFVDWNSEIPLSRELRLSPAARSATRFIIVPPETAKKYNKPGMEYYSSLPLNIGVRRAKGKYVFFAPADAIFSGPSLKALFAILDGNEDFLFDLYKTFFMIGRKDVPWQFWERKPSLYEWERYLQLHSHHLNYENTFHGTVGGYGCLGAHRDIWAECQGVREDVAGYGLTDIDMGLRVETRYPAIPLAGFGVITYDMLPRPKENTRVHSDTITGMPSEIGMENDGWGLKDLALPEERSLFAGEYEYSEEEGRVGKVDIGDSKGLKVDRKVITHAIEQIHGLNKEQFLQTFLGWYSANFLPKKYLEYGLGRDLLYLFVTLKSTSVEIYGIDTFEGSGPNYAAPNQISTLLLRVGHRGYVHLVTGDPSTGFDRLQKAFVGPMTFDLIVFRPDLFGDSCEVELLKAARALGPNGALILIGKDAPLFSWSFSVLSREFPGRLLVGANDRNVALFFNVT